MYQGNKRNNQTENKYLEKMTVNRAL